MTEQPNRQAAIEEKIRTELAPRYLEVTNESHMHSVPRGSETHFKVVVVSEKFEGLFLLKRHRLVQGFLSGEIASIKAMSLHTFTPVEWEARAAERIESPKCAGAKSGANP